MIHLIKENKLAIIGSRTFNNYTYAKKAILDIIKKYKIAIDKIISGGAPGADKIAEIFADKYNIPIEIIKPDWSNGKIGGVLRNTDIIKKSDYVIAFWDGKSKGTEDSIKKAKKLNKKVFIIKVDPNSINEQLELNEGVRLDSNNEYVFDFTHDEKNDLLKLQYNKDLITSKTANAVKYFYSYRFNADIDTVNKLNLINYIKRDLQEKKEYQHLINKAIIGLFNNPYFELSDVDLILIPQSSSTLNFDIATKIKNKIPNALFLKDTIVKNELENVTLNYDLLKSKNVKQDTIIAIENMLSKANVNNSFKIKKIPPKFRKFIINFLKIDLKNKQLLNQIVNGKILIVDDFAISGTTFKEIDRIINLYSPKEIIYYSLLS